MNENDIITDGNAQFKVRKLNKNISISIGMIIPFAGNGDIPVGCLLCNGASVSKTTYQDLFNVIGYTYGGEGEYFKLPDLTNKFIEGNETSGINIEAGLPNITGGVFPAHSSGVCWFNVIGESGAFYAYDWVGNNGVVNVSGSFEGNHGLGIDASRCSSIYGKSSTVQPPSLTMKYIIKAFDSIKEDDKSISITNLANDVANLQEKSNARYGFIKLPAITVDETNSRYLYDITVTTKGNPVYICVCGDNNPITDSSWINIYMYRNGTCLAHQIAESRSGSQNIPFSLSYLDVVGAGTYTYTLEINRGNGTSLLGEDGSVQSPQFIVYEI